MSSDRWEKIEDAYHVARGLGGEERTHFLDQCCGHDGAMRQQIEVLLAQDETPNSFLSRPAVELAAGWRSAVGRHTPLTGRFVGPYEVLEHIGSGGMGDVYRARDAKLNRDVALKVLPEAFSHDPDRLARFKREAQVLASLNHPNIAAIHGFEESDGVHALVLELVDGPTLGDRIAKGPMPLDEALPIARQVAEALAVAHEHGIVHRDLKPANIKLRPDGAVKVLDFGLAKAPAAPMADADVVTTPISSPPMTEAGVILGTPAYMSPEQTKGRSADKRSDVWAFGCVLYEMLAGKRAFKGEDASDTLAAVLRNEPDWAALPAAVPVPIRALIEGCLEKDRRERIADISTARFLMKEQRATAAASVVEAKARPRSSVVRSIAIGGGVLLAAIAGAAGWYFRPSHSTPIARFTITPAAALPTPSPYRDIDISPDGAHLVYNTGTNPASGDMWLRAIDSLESVKFQGLGTPKSPFFSPDNGWIGFFSGRELQKVSIKGGSPTSIGPIQGAPQGASWNSRNTIVFATTDLSTGLLTVSSDGGQPTVLTKPNPADGEVDHLFPSFLPSGDAVLFTVTTKRGIDHGEIAVLDLETGERKTLIRGGSGGRYIETGHLVYASAGALHVVRFDPTGPNVLSDPVPVVDHVLIKSTGAPDFSVSAHGTLVYVPGDVEPTQRSLVWVDRQGHEERIAAAQRAYVYARVSPDGTRVALDIRDQDNDIWVWDLAHEALSRVTADPAADVAPVWTPDGRDIIFGSMRAGVQNLYRQPADGSRPAERLTESASPQFPLSISPDGTQLVVRQQTGDPDFDFDLFLLHLNSPMASRDGAGQPAIARLLQTTIPKDNGTISPNGHWLAYESNESTGYQVFVTPFPDVERGRWQISNAGGRSPVWAPNGRELFYLDADGFLTRVPVETSGTFDHGKPARLLSTSYYRVNIRTYDVSRDGQKFLMIKQQTLPQRAITVVENWFEELKRRAPIK